ncbi:hypothetical protein CHARACLAT_008936 [Characodon lateralis]|uniref:Uncharacterized protein n=1 Tax=Characodon lateralis TaxID=208331 RepID=A0ABU7F1E1_9TELE|nr:hypothetical protein [Characodon lateralis]
MESCKLMPRDVHQLLCTSLQLYNQHSSHFPSWREHKYIGTENHNFRPTNSESRKQRSGLHQTKNSFFVLSIGTPPCCLFKICKCTVYVSTEQRHVLNGMFWEVMPHINKNG